MNKKRLIPCLDIMNGRLVKGTNFIHLKDVGDPIEMAKHYDSAGADELVFLDITATEENRGIIIDLVNDVANSISIPITVGGGIRNLDDIERILSAGAKKISISTTAVKNPQMVSSAVRKFGGSTIVIAVDAKIRGDRSGWDVYINGGKVNTLIDVVDWAKRMADMGVGEILLTSMDRDGMKNGYDIELIKAVSSAVTIPVIASGGAGVLKDFYDVIKYGGADAVLAASLFHYNEIGIVELKEYLFKRGIPVF